LVARFLFKPHLIVGGESPPYSTDEQPFPASLNSMFLRRSSRRHSPLESR
jgi:hypothetical protein